MYTILANITATVVDPAININSFKVLRTAYCSYSYIISKRIDGTIREVDKAQVHANSIASYTVMHRNFMVSALHEL